MRKEREQKKRLSACLTVMGFDDTTKKLVTHMGSLLEDYQASKRELILNATNPPNSESQKKRGRKRSSKSSSKEKSKEKNKEMKVAQDLPPLAIQKPSPQTNVAKKLTPVFYAIPSPPPSDKENMHANTIQSETFVMPEATQFGKADPFMNIDTSLGDNDPSLMLDLNVPPSFVFKSGNETPWLQEENFFTPNRAFYSPGSFFDPSLDNNL